MEVVEKGLEQDTLVRGVLVNKNNHGRCAAIKSTAVYGVCRALDTGACNASNKFVVDLAKHIKRGKHGFGEATRVCYRLLLLTRPLVVRVMSGGGCEEECLDSVTGGSG